MEKCKLNWKFISFSFVIECIFISYRYDNEFFSIHRRITHAIISPNVPKHFHWVKNLHPHFRFNGFNLHKKFSSTKWHNNNILLFMFEIAAERETSRIFFYLLIIQFDCCHSVNNWTTTARQINKEFSNPIKLNFVLFVCRVWLRVDYLFSSTPAQSFHLSSLK
jgi:hypothetical protein